MHMKKKIHFHNVETKEKKKKTQIIFTINMIRDANRLH